MLKEATYQQKFQMLNDWFSEIIETVKRDLKNEHIKKDWGFIRKHFAGKNINKLTNEDLVEAYRAAVADDENGEAVGEFITSRWLLKNTEVYSYFEEQLSHITTDFGSLTELDPQQSAKIMEGGISRFGALRTYIFAVLNSVVFPEQIFRQLEKKSKEEIKHRETESKVAEEQMQLDDLKKSHEREVARLTDKYEKKLQGMQKKYIVDVDSFKKQIAQLQRKLQER